MTTTPDTCALCATADGRGPATTTVVAAARDWILATLTGYGVPGWYSFQTRAHVLQLGELSDAALTDLGVRLAEAIAAVRSATMCDKVYVHRFGETYEHWHLLLCARPDSVPTQFRGPRYVTERERFREDAQCAVVNRQVATELAGWNASEPVPSRNGGA